MTQAPPRLLTHTEREDWYYKVLAGLFGAHLLQSVIDLELPKLLARHGGALTRDEIIAQLALHAKRGAKWVLNLRHAGLLEPAAGEEGAQPRYRAGPLMRALFHPDGAMEYFYRDFLRYNWKVLEHNLADVVRGKQVPQVPYPPQTFEQAELLESWMRETAKETLETIERAFDFRRVRRYLDVAGGDATIATTLARKYPELRATVFNLPNSAYLGRQNVAKKGMAGRVTIVEGDFRRDPLPNGDYDLVLFSRVLADWPADVCLMLLTKARDVLSPGGRVLICEPMADENPDLTLAWEFGYIAYDDFGVEVYKPLAAYEALLAQAGFRVLQATRRSQESIHTVLLAERQ